MDKELTLFVHIVVLDNVDNIVKGIKMIDKDKKKILRELIKQGWILKRIRKHWILYPENDEYSPVIFSLNKSSCPHAYYNFLMRIKKRGYKI